MCPYLLNISIALIAYFFICVKMAIIFDLFQKHRMETS
jgi:hypothetical protein